MNAVHSGAAGAWPVLRAAQEGRVSPWLERFLSGTGRAMHRHGMLGEGEGILKGVSGGKDSLALSVALALRRSRISVRHWMEAALVDWEEFPMPPESLERIAALFSVLDMPFSVLRSSIATVASRLGLPLAAVSCPRRATDPRSALKGVVAELAKMDRLVREKIYRAWYGTGEGGGASTARAETSAGERREVTPGEEG